MVPPATGEPATSAPAVASRNERFRKADRLLKRSEFLRVQRRGRRFTTPHLVVLSIESLTGRTRVGITASKKIGNAPTRNRVKRRFREIFRQNKAAWPEATDIVIIARSASVAAAYNTLQDDLLAWAERAKRGTSK